MSENSGAKTAAGCLIAIIVTPCAVLLKGFVLSKLWFWFIVPLGVPAISLWHAWGIAILAAMFSHQASTSTYDPKVEEYGFGYVIAKSIIMGILMPLLTWFFGYIAYSLMS